MHRSLFRAGLAVALSYGGVVFAQPEEPALREVVEDALSRRPEVAAAHSRVEAQRYRRGPAGALPDPSVSLTLQNDGFGGLRIGEMEGSYLGLMLSQPLYWPGKQGLREQVVDAELTTAQADEARARLSVEAEVRRAYVEWARLHERRALVQEEEALWRQSEAVAKVRYEVGEAPQADLLRAQVERARVAQRRVVLDANLGIAAQRLNRARGHAPQDPIPLPEKLGDAPAEAPTVEAALADAEARSPELAAARAATLRTTRVTALARRERWPDFAVSAGIMYRGALEPMWTVGISSGLPVFSAWKQRPLIAEAEARTTAAGADTAELLETIRLRTRERVLQLAATAELVRLYRAGLLIQSSAAVDSALAQYQVGKVPFTAVLEATRALISDREAFLDARAGLRLLAIAQREVSLASSEVSVAGGGGMPTTASTPSAGSRAAGSTNSSNAAAPAGQAAMGM